MNLWDWSKSSEKIRMLVQIVSVLLPQLCSNESIQILLKMAWFLTLGTGPIFIRICMRSSEQNRDNISSLICGKMLNFGMEAFFIFLIITTKLVISQINFLGRHNFGTLLQKKVMKLLLCSLTVPGQFVHFHFNCKSEIC